MVSAENSAGSFETWRNTGSAFVLKFSSRHRFFFFFFFFFFERAAVTANKKRRRKRDGGKKEKKKRSTTVIFVAIVHDGRFKACRETPKYNGCWLTCARKWKYYGPLLSANRELSRTNDRWIFHFFRKCLYKYAECSTSSSRKKRSVAASRTLQVRGNVFSLVFPSFFLFFTFSLCSFFAFPPPRFFFFFSFLLFFCRYPSGAEQK